MKKEELREIMDLLEVAGVDGQLCDVPVRVSSCPVVCGLPREAGDDDWGDYLMLPRQLVGMYPEMLIPAEGDSMRDVGFEPGDRLRVCFGLSARDGDSVLAWIDGRCTVKSFYTDDEGQTWLVPQNEAYDAMLLTEGMDARILGVVTSVEKSSPRPAARSLVQSVRRTKNKWSAAKRLSSKEVDRLIVRIGDDVVHARQWFAVYKAMVEYDVQPVGDYQGFCSRVRALLPGHAHLPDAKEVARMEVCSFAKPIAMWEETNAPVAGSRFRDYRRIALSMMEYLSERRFSSPGP